MSKQEATDNLIEWIDNSSDLEAYKGYCAGDLEEEYMEKWAVHHPQGNTLHLTPDGYSLHDVDWDQIEQHLAVESCDHCENDEDECTCDYCEECGEKVPQCQEEKICKRCLYCDELIDKCSCEGDK